jgi:TRAP-type C4-dicarboxylate transport system permease small subunit
LIPFVIFGIKAAIEIKNLIKHRRDANGDSIFKAAHYTGLIVFSLFFFFNPKVLLVALAGLLGTITFEYPSIGIPKFIPVIPLIFAWGLIVLLSLLPFVNFFQKKTASGVKGRREMLTAL